MLQWVRCEKTAGAAHCLMSSAASERRFIVKAPSITAPPCGLCLNQQPGSLSTVEMVPWVRIILSKSYFRQYFMPLLLISFLRTQKGSDGIFLPYFHLALSVSLPFLLFSCSQCPRRQIGFLHLASFPTPAVFNSPRSPSKEPSSVFFSHTPIPPQTSPLRSPPSPACLSGEFEREKGAVIKDKDESVNREKQTRKQIKPLSKVAFSITVTVGRELRGGTLLTRVGIKASPGRVVCIRV